MSINFIYYTIDFSTISAKIITFVRKKPTHGRVIIIRYLLHKFLPPARK